MGICFSKKKETNANPTPPPNPSSSQPLPSQEMAAAVASCTKKDGKEAEEHDQQPRGGPPAKHASVAAVVEKNPPSSTATAAAESAAKQAIRRNGVSAVPEEESQVATTVSTVRTSSCTKEEVESILIQCGRLSRNSSGAEGCRQHRSRKRSYDFDCGDRSVEEQKQQEEEGEGEGREKPRFGRSSHHSRHHSRERDGSEHKRSGSRERGSGGRRLSRSPGRRSDVPVVVGSSSSYYVDNNKSRGQAPGKKMVSVPAREKTTTCVANSDVVGNKRGGIEKVVGGMRSASPRSRSPAPNPSSSKSCNENAHPQLLPPQQPPSTTLSRSSSKKWADQSPYRRNPMAEVDGNVVVPIKDDDQLLVLPSKTNLQVVNDDNQVQSDMRSDEGTRKPPQSSSAQQTQRSGAGENSTQPMRRLDVRNEVPHATNGGSTAGRSVRGQLMSFRVKEQQPEPTGDDVSVLLRKGGDEVVVDLLVPTLTTTDHPPNPRATITRTRSSRRSSRDLDAAAAANSGGFNPDALLCSHHPPAGSSYASLLLEDIHNYHQHNNNNTAFSLPACVSKACSILEAVAELNSSSSSYSAAPTKISGAAAEVNGYHHCAKKTQQAQFVEPAGADDDPMTKYVTARRDDADLGPQESAGSNSVVGQPWAATPWEPNSVDSTDRCWPSSSWSNNGAAGEDEELIVASASPDHKTSHKHHRRQRSGGGFEASGRRRSSSGVAANQSASAATTIALSSGKKTESGGRHHPPPPTGRGGSNVVGGNAKALGA